ncbi:N-acetyltransferase GCN5 [Cellulophaga geojensis KL-A]|uniref:N-acetyltransferase GCN5 n=2 Tax=Cellulophaga TaxID=104264 RepID=A0ABN0RJC9_9FLAO|nr:N-acetyltransferase GCN5 [Cellulophaga geojensis KL-A]
MLNPCRMEIRFAEQKDLPQIIDLCKEHAEYEQADYERKNKSELLYKFLFGHNPCLKCLVVEQENLIVGYATFMKQFSTWETEFYIYLDCLFLKENTRGNGVGRLLMEKIKSYAKNQKCSIIQWQTPDFNKKAIDFYRKIGVISKSKERFIWTIESGKASR